MRRRVSALVRDRLVASGKVTVVATEAERARLVALRRRVNQSQRYRGDDPDRLVCPPGEDLPPNSVLQVAVGKELALRLFPLRTSCLQSSAMVRWTPKRPEVAVGEAVALLLEAVGVGSEG